MKVVVISDSHGNIANLKHVLGFAKKIEAAAIIHCGDWNNQQALETVLNFGINLYTVLGNADIDSELIKTLRKKSNKFDDRFLKIEIDGRKIGIIHNINNLETTLKDLDVVFCGHWHKQIEMIRDGVKVINPGALENKISFVVYNTAGKEAEIAFMPKGEI